MWASSFLQHINKVSIIAIMTLKIYLVNAIERATKKLSSPAITQTKV